MKKLVFLLVAVLVVSGAAWGQTFGNNLPSGGFTPTGGGFQLDFFDMFSAVPTISTEARYSAGIFSSLVDDYIDVNWYDYNVGNFIFVGGYPSDGSAVDATARVTGLPAGANFPNADPTYAISFGFGKTLKSVYLGMYYGGSLMNAQGNYNNTGSTKLKDSEKEWSNSLALLLGTSNFGAFRFDMILNTQIFKNKVDGDISTPVPNVLATGKLRVYAPSFAVTWGLQNVWHPYVSIGYKFPEKEIRNNNPGNQELIIRDLSVFGLQTGIWYDLNETSALIADFVFGALMGQSYKSSNAGTWNDDGNIIVAGLKGAYKKTFEAGKFAFGFKPNIAFGLRSDDTPKSDKELALEIYTGVNMGLKFQANEKFAIFTGASLRIFDYLTVRNQGNTKDIGSWEFQGIAWDETSLAGTNNDTLGFGLTITPNKNLVVGVGLNALLDRIISFNLLEMRAITGQALNPFGAASTFFAGMSFDLTVSYRF